MVFVASSARRERACKSFSLIAIRGFFSRFFLSRSMLSPQGVQGLAMKARLWTATVSGGRTRSLARARETFQDGQVNRRERRLTLRTRSRLGRRARLIACSYRATVQN